MAFVYERVGEENEKLWKEIGWRDWGNDLIGFYAKSRWCADKEHGVYMLPIGSFRGETPDYYDLAYIEDKEYKLLSDKSNTKFNAVKKTSTFKKIFSVNNKLDAGKK